METFFATEFSVRKIFSLMKIKICLPRIFFFSCKGPKEFDIARTFYIISKSEPENLILKPEDYLATMKTDKNDLLPFIEVINDCKNSFSAIF